MRNARTSRAASLHGTMMKAKEQMTTSAVRVPIWPALNWECGDHAFNICQQARMITYYNDISTFDKRNLLPCSHTLQESTGCPTLLQSMGILASKSPNLQLFCIYKHTCLSFNVSQCPGSMQSNSNPFLQSSASLIPPATSHVFLYFQLSSEAIGSPRNHQRPIPLPQLFVQ